MREAVGEQNEEVYQLYDLASVESARYVSISQKQMLLLALYYLCETMYLGVQATFGTMKYIDDVRVSMRQERQMARDFSVSLGRSKFYDHVVKLQNFDCPADLRIAEAAPSDERFPSVIDECVIQVRRYRCDVDIQDLTAMRRTPC
jgi:hypothetical protein